jgi:hypothetical protein
MSDPAKRQAFIDWVTPKPAALPAVGAGAGTRPGAPACCAIPYPNEDVDYGAAIDDFLDGLEWLGDLEREAIAVGVNGVAGAGQAIVDFFGKKPKGELGVEGATRGREGAVYLPDGTYLKKNTNQQGPKQAHKGEQYEQYDPRNQRYRGVKVQDGKVIPVTDWQPARVPKR